MTPFEILSVLTAIFSGTIAFVTLYHTRKLDKQQIDLQQRQLVLENESAKLAKLQRDQIEAGMQYPSLTVRIYDETIHYADGDSHDTAIELVINNASALNRSINDCVVGLLDDPTDKFPRVARQGKYREKLAEYPIAIQPHSSVILFSYGRYLESIYRDRFGATATDDKAVVARLDIGGMKDPFVQVIGTYSPTSGLRSV
jgi:hypothetical protein